jgi:hypothetical protein
MCGLETEMRRVEQEDVAAGMVVWRGGVVEWWSGWAEVEQAWVMWLVWVRVARERWEGNCDGAWNTGAA